MYKLRLIIKREFLTKVKSKSYFILIFLSPLLMLSMFAAIFYFASKEKNSESNQVKFLSITNNEIYKDIVAHHPTIHFEQNNTISLPQAEKLIDDGDYNGFIYTNLDLSTMQICGDEETPFQSLKFILEKHEKNHLLHQNQVDENIIAQLNQMSKVNIIHKETSEKKVQKWVKGTIAVGAGYLIMMFVIIYGNSVMRSIIEEKNSRIIEIMVGTVKPFQLLLGKIIGNALAGILQFLIWAILLALGLFLIEANFSEVGAVEMSKITQIFTVIWQLNYIEIIVSFILFFLSGYLLYSSFYASVGAAVDSETDTQQFVHPILLPLMFAVYIGIVAVVNGNPNGSTATLFSFIPFTSPVVMLMRIPFGVPFWQIAVSLALLLVSFVTTVYLASRIYRIGILTYGNKPQFKQLFKWMFQKQ